MVGALPSGTSGAATNSQIMNNDRIIPLSSQNTTIANKQSGTNMITTASPGISNVNIMPPENGQDVLLSSGTKSDNMPSGIKSEIVSPQNVTVNNQQSGTNWIAPISPGNWQGIVPSGIQSERREIMHISPGMCRIGIRPTSNGIGIIIPPGTKVGIVSSQNATAATAISLGMDNISITPSGQGNLVPIENKTTTKQHLEINWNTSITPERGNSNIIPSGIRQGSSIPAGTKSGVVFSQNGTSFSSGMDDINIIPSENEQNIILPAGTRSGVVNVATISSDSSAHNLLVVPLYNTTTTVETPVLVSEGYAEQSINNKIKSAESVVNNIVPSSFIGGNSATGAVIRSSIPNIKSLRTVSSLQNKLDMELKAFRCNGCDTFKCKVCHSHFITYRELLNHKEMHRNEIIFECKDCGLCFFKRYALEVHSQMHNSSTQKFFKCIKCGVCFEQSFELKFHSQMHNSSSSTDTLPQKSASSETKVSSIGVIKSIVGSLPSEPDSSTNNIQACYYDPIAYATEVQYKDPSVLATKVHCKDPLALVTEVQSKDPLALTTKVCFEDSSALATKGPYKGSSALTTEIRSIDPLELVTEVQSKDPLAFTTEVHSKDSSDLATKVSCKGPSALTTKIRCKVFSKLVNDVRCKDSSSFTTKIRCKDISELVNDVRCKDSSSFTTNVGCKNNSALVTDVGCKDPSAHATEIYRHKDPLSLTTTAAQVTTVTSDLVESIQGAEYINDEFECSECDFKCSSESQIIEHSALHNSNEACTTYNPNNNRIENISKADSSYADTLSEFENIKEENAPIISTDLPEVIVHRNHKEQEKRVQNSHEKKCTANNSHDNTYNFHDGNNELKMKTLKIENIDDDDFSQNKISENFNRQQHSNTLGLEPPNTETKYLCNELIEVKKINVLASQDILDNTIANDMYDSLPCQGSTSENHLEAEIHQDNFVDQMKMPDNVIEEVDLDNTDIYIPEGWLREVYQETHLDGTKIFFIKYHNPQGKLYRGMKKLDNSMLEGDVDYSGLYIPDGWQRKVFLKTYSEGSIIFIVKYCKDPHGRKTFYVNILGKQLLRKDEVHSYSILSNKTHSKSIHAEKMDFLTKKLIEHPYEQYFDYLFEVKRMFGHDTLIMCKLCDHLFQKKVNAHNHTSTHIRNLDNQLNYKSILINSYDYFICTVCHHLITERQDIQTHMQTHKITKFSNVIVNVKNAYMFKTNERMTLFCCELCSYVCQIYSFMAIHLKMQHYGAQLKFEKSITDIEIEIDNTGKYVPEGWQRKVYKVKNKDTNHSYKVSYISPLGIMFYSKKSVLMSFKSLECYGIALPVNVEEMDFTHLSNELPAKKRKNINVIEVDNSEVGVPEGWQRKIFKRVNGSLKRDYFISYISPDKRYLSIDIEKISYKVSRGEQNHNSKCAMCIKGEAVCCSVCSTPTGNQLTKAMMTALNKLDNLTDKVESLETVLISQNERLGFHINSDSESGNETRRGSSSQSGEQSLHLKEHQKDVAVSNTNNKRARVETLKGRQFRLLQEKLRSQGNTRVKTESKEESSGEVFQRSSRKKISRREEEDCNHSVSTRLGHTGAILSDNDSNDVNNSEVCVPEGWQRKLLKCENRSFKEQYFISYISPDKRYLSVDIDQNQLYW